MDRQNIQRAEQWQAVLKALSTLSYRSHDLNGYLHEITCGVSQLLNSDWSIVTIHEESKGQVVASNLDIEDAENSFLVHESVSEIVVRSGQPFFIDDIKHRPEEANRMEGYVCYLGVPLRVSQGDVIGTICSFSMQPQHYDAETISTVELFAERAATAIDNYRLYQKQQQFNELLEAEVTKRTKELHTAQAKLIEHERLAAIGEFAAMIVHEIRNPLTTVQMGLNYFTRLDLPQPAQDRLSLARDEAERLANLLQEILSYSKPQNLKLAEVDVHIFIQKLLVPLRSMPEAQGRAIEYLPLHSPALILADSDKLKQVFINLIRNACEAVGVGEIVRWSVVQISAEQICISVHNGGAPIPGDVLPQLTLPFYSTKAEGTGLGLAIVKRILEAHNGELLIESSETKGTIFSARLPLRRLAQ
ncbi:GHKL domain-containing protein [Phormidesmis priestleyi ULC007]|uniref:histidine kinase n=2 Tax=Phormidesmis priestleyi TaxID=268141 RepID=A0A2T1D5H3_9CYAN|nr:GHKL domain-containing protein [Phormidesmis priestleyi ULC007]PZO45964.1 MAG: GHKL domain-containing protein [Phormidesmis priestleyi]